MSPDQMNTTLAYHFQGVSFHFEPNINPRIQWRLLMIVVFTTHLWEWNINFSPVRAAKFLLKAVCISYIHSGIIFMPFQHFYAHTHFSLPHHDKRKKKSILECKKTWLRWIIGYQKNEQKIKFCWFSLVPVNWLPSTSE